MPKDRNGREINVGDVVRHVYEPLPAGKAAAAREEAHRFHFFQGTSKVVRLWTQSVEVEPTNRNHIPLHCSELVEVVSP